MTSRKHRIEVLKALFRWLRSERHLLTAAEDPTYGALAVPQGRPEQWVHSKVIPRENHDEVLKHLIGVNRDRLLVLAGTGWHVTELTRFAAAGVVAALPSTASREHGASAVLVCPRRKSGEQQRTPVSAKVTAAAKRVRAHGSFSLPKFEAAIKSACLAAEVEPFSLVAIARASRLGPSRQAPTRRPSLRSSATSRQRPPSDSTQRWRSYRRYRR